MKAIVRFVIGYIVGALIVASILMARGDSLENTSRLLISWLPMVAAYGAVLVVALRLAKAAEWFGVFELCGMCVGLFPLISGLWPTYSMRWDLALIMVVVQCVALTATVFIAFFCRRLIRSKGKPNKGPPSKVK